MNTRARTIAVVAWCSFLAASGGTMVLFAFLDPWNVEPGSIPPWWTSRHAVYALGFFFVWIVGACASSLAIYMAHTDRAP